MLVSMVLPWWVLFVLFLGVGFFVKYIPYEYIVVGMVADYVYAIPVQFFYGVQHVYALGAVLVVGIFLFRKMFTRA
ncbi:MAG: hypothetical protein ACR2IQ_00290 [Minisyncoccia bacterium]